MTSERFRFHWRRPKVLVVLAAERPPLFSLNRYPGVVIGCAVRLAGRRYLSVLWGRPGAARQASRGRGSTARRDASRCQAIPSYTSTPVRRDVRMSLRCVLPEGHEPVLDATGQPVACDPPGHNFGGLGPYTPGQRRQATR